ncbi:MAG: mechanosensitive ion channel [Prevotella sp.]|nr:mechanosensitive ion channel [Prevotella sp.]
MEKTKIFLERVIEMTGVSGDSVAVVRYVILVIAAFLLAWLAGWLCKRFLVPLVLKVTSKTEAKWDDVVLGRPVLLSACSIVPAIVIWSLLPHVFYEFPRVEEIVGRLTAIYFTVMMVRTIIVFIDSFKLLEGEKRTARQQYLYSVCGVLKIIMVFIAAIVVIAIIVNKDPSTLFAGLGAASAILMLAFQDTIKGLVAGIRLTNNDMLHIGDWITMPSAGINGRVEEITLTVVKVRNFDNTIVTVSPQALVDGSFQNWLGMESREGRKQTRKVYIDFSSLSVNDEGEANITRFRHHMEQWLQQNQRVISQRPPLVHHVDAAQASGYCLEFVFWLKAQDALTFEHDTSDIMDYIYAKASEFGLTFYQPGRAV